MTLWNFYLWLVTAYGVFMLVVWKGPPLVKAIKRKRILARPSNDAMVNLVLGLLDNAPDWRIDEHYARHPSGVELWIANKDCAFKMKVHNVDRELTEGDKIRLWNAFLRVKQSMHNPDTMKLAENITKLYGQDV